MFLHLSSHKFIYTIPSPASRLRDGNHRGHREKAQSALRNNIGNKAVVLQRGGPVGGGNKTVVLQRVKEKPRGQPGSTDFTDAHGFLETHLRVKPHLLSDNLLMQ